MDKKRQFVKVIKKNEKLIYKVATLYSNGTQYREDLYQEIIFQLWKSFDSFNAQSQLSTWIYRVAMNTAIYNLRSSKRQIDTIPFEFVKEQYVEEFDGSKEQKIKLLYQYIQTLNLLERGIILLYLEGKSHLEIAKIVGITVSNVGTKISRIKERMKTNIKKTY